MKTFLLLILLFASASLATIDGQDRKKRVAHEGLYQKNLVFRGPITGDEIVYTLYLPPAYAREKSPFPVIVFLHGAGGGNASPEVVTSYETAREAGAIGDFALVFPEQYGGTVWRDGAKGKRPETNVLKELLPHLQKEHGLTDNRSQRTIMGFSMGAAGSLYWGSKHLGLFSTAVALDAGRGTSSTDTTARNYVPDYREKTDTIRKTLQIRIVQGALKTRTFLQSLDHLQIPYDFEELPEDIETYPPGSPCRNRKIPTKKMLHNPACLTAGPWGRQTWTFIEKNTPRGEPASTTEEASEEP